MSCFAVMSAWEIEIIVRVCLFLAYFTDLRERGVTFRYFPGRMSLYLCYLYQGRSPLFFVVERRIVLCYFVILEGRFVPVSYCCVWHCSMFSRGEVP